MLKVLLLSLSRQYTVDGQYIPSLFIEPEVRHDKTSYKVMLSRKRVNLAWSQVGPRVNSALGQFSLGQLCLV